jgi:hypothetical protein
MPVDDDFFDEFKSFHSDRAERRRFGWVPGPVCSERYRELAEQYGDEDESEMSPFDNRPSSLTLGPLGLWSSDFTPVLPTARALEPKASPAVTKELSGPKWVSKFPTSNSVNDLSPGFKSSVVAFLKAITDAGGTVHIAVTYRPPERAYLMHWAWEIVHGNVQPSAVPAKAGVDIEWDHGDDQASIKAAQEMVTAFQLDTKSKYVPALESNHTKGKAIDMHINISKIKTIKDNKGNDINITKKSDLYPVRKTYGVIKLLNDPPHWSEDGH